MLSVFASPAPSANAETASILVPSDLKIRIENPLTGSGKMTSAAHARRYVKRGLAEWTSPASIHMVDCHERLSAEHATRPTVSDGAGFASIEAIQGLPCAGDADRAMWGPRTDPPDEVIHSPVYLLRSRIVILSFGRTPLPTFRGLPLIT